MSPIALKEYDWLRELVEIIEKYSTCLRKIKPDYNLVYADRFESFGAIIASSQMNIPTIHIEGGDKTEGGTLDDSARHAMTKISHIHITTNEDAKKRIFKSNFTCVLSMQFWLDDAYRCYHKTFQCRYV